MQNVKVQFLNVGWGDAHLIQTPSGTVTLIDGGNGEFSVDQDHPLSWMERNGVDQLDWMILTHIHEDHINGLLDIARKKQVIKAILPYEPFELPLEQLAQRLGDTFEARVFHMLSSYLELIRILNKQGTEIKWRSEYAATDRSVVWSEEGITLTHLYPWKGDPLPAYDILINPLSNLTEYNDEAIVQLLLQFFELSNHDSSVYRLSSEQGVNSNVLLGGDQLEPGWERLAKRMDIKSSIYKVSHHGLSDGFNPRILAWIQPKHCIIPISVERSLALQEEWDQLYSSTMSTIYLTGSFAIGEKHCIENGAISIEIGY